MLHPFAVFVNFLLRAISLGTSSYHLKDQRKVPLRLRLTDVTPSVLNVCSLLSVASRRVVRLSYVVVNSASSAKSTAAAATGAERQASVTLER